MDFEGFIARQASRILRVTPRRSYLKKPQRGFSKYVKKRVLSIQLNRCNYCYRLLDSKLWSYWWQ